MWQQLVEAGYSLGDRTLYLRNPPLRGDDVRVLQARLNLLGFDAGREDGVLGAGTDHAVRDFQRNVGMRIDGIVGDATLGHLLRLRPASGGPGSATVRELHEPDPGRSGLEDLSVAIAAGSPHARFGPTGLPEPEVSRALAAALVARLRAMRANPIDLAPGPLDSADDVATAANRAHADILVALRLNFHTDPRAEGSTVLYCGREGWVSVAGQRLAESIQTELVARLGLKDGRIHPKWLPLLRQTRMPAVHVEPCYLSNPSEERRLRQSDFREAVAGAIVAGLLRRFHRPLPS